jgi:hypothetical protein
LLAPASIESVPDDDRLGTQPAQAGLVDKEVGRTAQRGLRTRVKASTQGGGQDPALRQVPASISHFHFRFLLVEYSLLGTRYQRCLKVLHNASTSFHVPTLGCGTHRDDGHFCRLHLRHGIFVCLDFAVSSAVLAPRDEFGVGDS